MQKIFLTDSACIIGTLGENTQNEGKLNKEKEKIISQSWRQNASSQIKRTYWVQNKMNGKRLSFDIL